MRKFRNDVPFTNYAFLFRKQNFWNRNYKLFLERLLSLRSCLTQDKIFCLALGISGSRTQRPLEERFSQGQITQPTYLHKQAKILSH